jgi:hypothetical protein
MRHDVLRESSAAPLIPRSNERGGPYTVEKWLKAGKRKQRMLAPVEALAQ